MQQMIKSTLWVFFVLFPCVTFGFHPDKHEQHTQAAFEMYSVCQQYFPHVLPLQFDSQAIDQVVKANTDLDAPSFSRAWNWHFYDAAYDYQQNQPGYIENNVWGMKRSLHPYFIKQVVKLENGQSNKTRYIALGELMHLIQDMVVPAHVAPIYHVAWQPDPFDDYEPSLPTVLSMSRIKCGELLKHNASPVFLLTQLANRTRKAILSPNEQGRTWRDYWLIYPDQVAPLQSGFTQYGMCGRAGFGLESDAVSIQHCQQTKSQYDAFYHARVTDSIETSLMLLFFINLYP
ncbi:hypothetical protein [uncultured Shewanella sp.]|uniref:hypothetical protein n=1 Tax=uncultured Shewanella sp. TaxID=173975 RepID=UPI002616949B|nr:hypothetical protein [uncultured Shewanella sp.]